MDEPSAATVRMAVRNFGAVRRSIRSCRSPCCGRSGLSCFLRRLGGTLLLSGPSAVPLQADDGFLEAMGMP
jgi:hypothetical protein